MKKIFFLFGVTIVLLLFFNSCNILQSGKLNEVQLTEEFIDGDIFIESIDFYERFLYENPNDGDFNYKMGFALLNTKGREKESIEYFKKAKYIFNKPATINRYVESSYQLARAYKASYLFIAALQELADLRPVVEKNPNVLAVINREIFKCESGSKLFENKINFKITNLGDSINSEYQDHSPVISADESVLIFTSRRPNGWDEEIDDDGNYNEDIFISEKIDGHWTNAKSLKNINTKNHEASCGLSVDGQTLFIYKAEDYGNIYQSNLENGKWSTPVKLGPNINTDDRETHASLSADGKHLYFTTDRPGGFGGLDIYVSEKMKNGMWGPPRNLGEGINTKYNEEGPFIHPDGKTLYFSSKGHENLGGYDIFKSEKTEFGTWKPAVNIGYPINTVSDDVFYTPTADGQHAYYSSRRSQDASDNDIFLITLDSVKRSDITVMIGSLFSKCSSELPGNLKITVSDTESGEEYHIKPNSKNKRFIFIAKWGRTYNIVVSVNDEIIFTDKVSILPDNAPKMMKYKSIRIDPDVNCK
ncbi:MAG: PD40 domain-containing protein [Bacteroidales bacterium]|nr:PD40 domain-containing protein [Bacteroidales bacterium]